MSVKEGLPPFAVVSRPAACLRHMSVFHGTRLDTTIGSGISSWRPKAAASTDLKVADIREGQRPTTFAPFGALTSQHKKRGRSYGAPAMQGLPRTVRCSDLSMASLLDAVPRMGRSLRGGDDVDKEETSSKIITSASTCVKKKQRTAVGD